MVFSIVFSVVFSMTLVADCIRAAGLACGDPALGACHRGPTPFLSESPHFIPGIWHLQFLPDMLNIINMFNH
jgi:hypothetical protein